jgi:hypothetical protein
MNRTHRALALLNLLLALASFAIGLAEPPRPRRGTDDRVANTHAVEEVAALPARSFE